MYQTSPSELAEQAAAMRRLARSLVGADDVDDVLQDTRLAAARSRAQIADGPAWLRGTVRRLSAMWHRREVRRRRHEQVAGELRPSTSEIEPAALAAQAELVRDLGVALEALDEPYRGTIVLHFWRGLNSTEIAARQGVADSTVRTRLRRGIQRLRERLDGRYGDRAGWCTPMTNWLSGESATVAAPAVGVSLFGVIMKGKLLLAAGAALSLAWLGWPLIATPPMPVAMDPAATMTQAAERDNQVAANRKADRVPGHDLQRQAAMPAPESLADDEVLLRLRCIDERGNPLRGCRVVLRPRLQARVRSEAVIAERSAVDGRVALHAVATASSYELTVTAQDRVPAQRTFVPMPLGGVLALGDVVLPRGLSLTGRVIDTAGVPVAEAIVQLDVGSRSDQDGMSTPARQATTDARGVYVFTHLPPGDAHVRLLREHVLAFGGPPADGTVQWASCQLRRDHQNVAPDLVMAPVAASIRGVVVDDAGTPVRDARVRSGELSTCTDFEGRFTLFLPAAGTREPCTVHAEAPGHHSGERHDVAWGSSLQLTVARCAGIQMTVLDAVSRQPIEEFAVAVASNGGMTGFEPFALPRMERPNGQVLLHTLSPGRYAAWVRPGDVRLAAFLVEFEVDEGLGSVKVLAPQLVEREVQVVDRDGQAIVGTEVEALLARGEAAIRLDSRAVAPHVMWLEPVLVWQRSATGSRGFFVLRGGRGRTCTLRLLGPGHRPALVGDVRLDEGLGPLRIEVQTGSRVTGKLTPPELVAQFGPPAAQREVAANLRMLNGGHLRDGMRAQVLLRRADGTTYPEDPKDGNVQDDGTFCIEGVPAGDWQVCLRHRPLGLDDQSYRVVDVLGTLRDLDGRTTREQSFDISHLAGGTLRATVLVDGSPLRNSEVKLIYRHPNLSWGQLKVGEQAIPCRTDGDGRVLVELPPGAYGIEVALPGEGSQSIKLRATDSAHVAAGQTTEHTFGLLRRTLRVRVLDADGNPIAQRRFSMLADHLWLQAGTTDADGWLTIRSLPDQPVELVTWPIALVERDAQHAYIREHPYPEWLEVLQRTEKFDPARIGDTLEMRLSRLR